MGNEASASLQQIRDKRASDLDSLPLTQIGRTLKFWPSILSSIQETWETRNLLFLLTKRDVKTRYKDSSLGVLWSFMRPLVQLGVYYIAIGQVLGAARSIPNFAIFIFIGITVWTLFSETVTGATKSIVDNAGLVKKVYLPREIFPLSSAGNALFNFSVQLLILISAILLFAPINLDINFVLIPLSLLNLIVFSIAISMILSAINVYLRDTEHLVEVALVLLFWFSPIVYSFTFVVAAAKSAIITSIYLSNPVTLSIIGFQKALWAGGLNPAEMDTQIWPENLAGLLVISLLVSSILLLIGTRVFGKLQGNFAQQL